MHARSLRECLAAAGSSSRAWDDELPRVIFSLAVACIKTCQQVTTTVSPYSLATPARSPCLFWSVFGSLKQPVQERNSESGGMKTNSDEVLRVCMHIDLPPWTPCSMLICSCLTRYTDWYRFSSGVMEQSSCPSWLGTLRRLHIPVYLHDDGAFPIAQLMDQ